MPAGSVLGEIEEALHFRQCTNEMVFVCFWLYLSAWQKGFEQNSCLKAK